MMLLFLLLTSCVCPCHKGGPDPILRFEGPIDESYLEEPPCAYAFPDKVKRPYIESP